MFNILSLSMSYEQRIIILDTVKTVQTIQISGNAITFMSQNATTRASSDLHNSVLQHMNVKQNREVIGLQSV
jgi:hypothetical protein